MIPRCVCPPDARSAEHKPHLRRNDGTTSARGQLVTVVACHTLRLPFHTNIAGSSTARRELSLSLRLRRRRLLLLVLLLLLLLRRSLRGARPPAAVAVHATQRARRLLLSIAVVIAV
jgi:hypothetical protein